MKKSSKQKLEQESAEFDIETLLILYFFKIADHDKKKRQRAAAPGVRVACMSAQYERLYDCLIQLVGNPTRTRINFPEVATLLDNFCRMRLSSRDVTLQELAACWREVNSSRPLRCVGRFRGLGAATLANIAAHADRPPIRKSRPSGSGKPARCAVRRASSSSSLRP